MDIWKPDTNMSGFWMDPAFKCPVFRCSLYLNYIVCVNTNTYHVRSLSRKAIQAVLERRFHKQTWIEILGSQSTGRDYSRIFSLRSETKIFFTLNLNLKKWFSYKHASILWSMKTSVQVWNAKFLFIMGPCYVNVLQLLMVIAGYIQFMNMSLHNS
jgi:hypothetical protein